MPKLPRSYPQTFSCLRRSPPVSRSIECSSTAVVVVSTSAAPLENAEDTRYFRRTRGRTSSALRVLLPAAGSRRERPPSPPGFYGYLSRHFVRGLDTRWISQGPPLGLRLPPPPCEFLGNETTLPSLPRSRPSAEVDRARNVPAARLLFEEKISQSNTPDVKTRTPRSTVSRASREENRPSRETPGHSRRPRRSSSRVTRHIG